MAAQTLYVFLNKKLISCDTIVPLLLEYKSANSGVNISLFAPDENTVQVIERNELLFQAIKTIGTLSSLTINSNNMIAKFSNKVRRWSFLLNILLKLKLGSAKIIHFKYLNYRPAKILSWGRPEAIYLFMASEVVLTATELEAQKIMQSENPAFFVKSEIDKQKNLPTGGTLVGFDPQWELLKDERFRTKPKHIVTTPYKRNNWKMFINAHGQKFFDKIGVGSEETLAAIMLSSMPSHNQLKDPEDNGSKIFEETLHILAEHHPDLTYIVKPHPATDEKTFRQIKTIVSNARLPNIKIANIHPSALAERALFFIGNGVSTTFTVAKSFGIPTIEYTEYDDETMAATQGSSTNPKLVTHFILRDRTLLANTVSEIRSQPSNVLTPETFLDEEYDLVLQKLAF
jgi:hypothetical protein